MNGNGVGRDGGVVRCHDKLQSIDQPTVGLLHGAVICDVFLGPGQQQRVADGVSAATDKTRVGTKHCGLMMSSGQSLLQLLNVFVSRLTTHHS